jgi:hypothetical protein
VRPGEPSGPVEVTIVGWGPGLQALPVAVASPVRVEQPVQVAGMVQTDPGTRPARVIVAGWEERADEGRPERPGQFRPLDDESGLPTRETPR